MLLDVLDAFAEISVCTAYRLDGKEIRGVPASVRQAEAIEPVYETLAGWELDTTAVRRWADLPQQARRYVDRLGEIIGSEVALVGVGPDRSQSVIRPGSWLERHLKS